MNQTNLFIPSKIKVGFQERKDTFTGKLAYVIYFDEKGVLRKETSWKSWIDPKIETIEIENSPRAGYIFNKGQQRYGHWGSGRSVIRVYDPRDFEFEISVDNLIGLLMHSDVSKRDIVEECVYAWAGKELVLLPTNSEEYKQSVEYTKKQSEKISSKDLLKGCSYNQKKADESLIYVGHFEWFDWGYNRDYSKNAHRSLGKKHVFYNEKHKSFSVPSVSTFSSVNNNQPVENYAEIVDLFFSTINSQKIVEIKVVPFSKKSNDYYNYMYRKVEENCFEMVQTSNNYENDFTYLNRQNQRINFVFENNNCERINSKTNHLSYYNYHKPPPETALYKEVLAKVQEYGLNEKNVSVNEKIKLFSEIGFGDLVYVLPNKKEIKIVY